jgi:hypothetical protein
MRRVLSRNGMFQQAVSREQAIQRNTYADVCRPISDMLLREINDAPQSLPLADKALNSCHRPGYRH